MLKLLLTTYLLLILTHLYHRQDHFHGKLFISMLSIPTLRRKKTKRHQMISSKGIKMVKCLFRKMPTEQSYNKPPPKNPYRKIKRSLSKLGYSLVKSQVPAVSHSQNRRSGTALMQYFCCCRYADMHQMR